MAEEYTDEEKDLDLQRVQEGIVKVTKSVQFAQHIGTIRREFGTRTLDDGSEVCRRCGIRAEDHPLDVCAGGIQEAPQPTSKNGNGAKDDDLPLIDPDRVIQTLSQIGIPIVYVIPPGATISQFQNPTTAEVYSREWCEAEYRGALTNRKREKAGAR